MIDARWNILTHLLWRPMLRFPPTGEKPCAVWPSLFSVRIMQELHTHSGCSRWGCRKSRVSVSAVCPGTRSRGKHSLQKAAVGNAGPSGSGFCVCQSWHNTFWGRFRFQGGWWWIAVEVTCLEQCDTRILLSGQIGTTIYGKCRPWMKTSESLVANCISHLFLCNNRFLSALQVTSWLVWQEVLH